MQFIRHDERGYWLDEYLAYLNDQREKLPAGAREFALADWHYDISHHQCPHDSWLEYYSVRELESGERRQIRSIEIEARFLGAYHDGSFHLHYVGVTSYALDATTLDGARSFTGHGDWLIDEITLSKTGGLVHEIEFEAAKWTICCTDLRYVWIAK